MRRELELIRNVLAIATRREADLRADAAWQPVSFRYLRTEITSYGTHARFTQTSKRFEGGSLVSEELEGIVDNDTYEDMLVSAQNQFAKQAMETMRLFSWPLWLGRRDD